MGCAFSANAGRICHRSSALPGMTEAVTMHLHSKEPGTTGPGLTGYLLMEPGLQNSDPLPAEWHRA